MFLAALLAINALMGATFSIVRLILDNYTNPLFLVGYRMVLAGILLLGYVGLRRQTFRIRKTDLLAFLQVVIFHIYLAYVCEVWGLKFLSPAKVALLFNLTPFIAASIGFLMHRRRQSWQMILGLLIGFLGFMPILLEHTPIEDLFGQLGFLSIPELVILISICSGAYAWLVVENLVWHKKYPIFLVNGMGMLGGGILTLVTAAFLASYHSSSTLIQPWPYTDLVKLTGWVLVLILFSNVIFYNVYVWLMRHYSPTFLSFSGLTIPLFAAGWDWLIFNSTVSNSFWWSLVIVALGLGVYLRAESHLAAEELKTPAS